MREPKMSIYRTLLTCLLAGILLLLSSNPALAQEKVKPQLAILPFTMNAGDDLAHLKEGVRTMLASRIAAKAGVVVIGRAEVEKVVAGKVGSDPAAAAKILAADLVLTGSITALGASVSIDARLVTIATNDSASFFAVAENQSGIIGAVDQLASDITASISGVARQTRPTDQATTAAQPSAEPVVPADQSLHPDRMFKLPVPVPAPVKVPL